MEFNFNHDKKGYLEALGVSEEETDELLEKANKILKETSKSSEIVERFFKEFSKEELTFIIMNLLRRVETAEKNPFLEELADLFKTEQYGL